MARRIDRSIAIVVETAPPLPYWIGAIEELVGRGASVRLVSVHHRGPLHDAALATGAQIATLDAGRIEGYPHAVRRLRRLLGTDPVDLLHCVGPIPTIIGGLASRAPRRAVTLYHRHHIIGEEARLIPWLARHLASHTMTVSEAAARHAIEVDGIDPEHLCVAPNGTPRPRQVTPVERSMVRASLGVGPRERVVLAVARVRRVKGLDVLIDAMHLVAAESREKVHLVVVGDGPDRAELQRVAERAMGWSSHFVGYRDDVAPWLAMADVVAVPSRQESFGLVALEAMAAGRPVVASSVGALPEVLGGTGTLVPSADPGALAVALLAVLDDPGHASRMAASGNRRFESCYTIEAMVDGWLACYESALRRR